MLCYVGPASSLAFPCLPLPCVAFPCLALPCLPQLFSADASRTDHKLPSVSLTVDYSVLSTVQSSYCIGRYSTNTVWAFETMGVILVLYSVLSTDCRTGLGRD